MVPVKGVVTYPARDPCFHVHELTLPRIIGPPHPGIPELRPLEKRGRTSTIQVGEKIRAGVREGKKQWGGGVKRDQVQVHVGT